VSELTPRNLFPYPSERERPFFATFKAGVLAEDAAHYANSDNGNLIFQSTAIVTWDATNNLVFWTQPIFVTGYATPFKAEIAGAASMQIQQDEVIYFQMPRLIQEGAIPVQLYRSSRLFLEGVRLHDIRIFCARVGDTLYFGDGKSLSDGDTGVLWGGGLFPLSTVIPHKHEPAWKFIAPGPGITLLTPAPLITAPTLARADVFRNGSLLIDPDDYIYNFVTGQITLVIPTVVVPNPDIFVVLRETRDTSVSITSHIHAPKLIYTPTVGTSVLNALSTSPILLRVDVFKNGLLLTEGAGHDYTVDLTTGLITLVVASVLNDKFEIQRILGI
jgi:hypothetical protein